MSNSNSMMSATINQYTKRSHVYTMSTDAPGLGSSAGAKLKKPCPEVQEGIKVFKI